MSNISLFELQAGIKIRGRNINNLRYADDTTYGRKWRGTKEPFDGVKKESERASLRLNIKKTKIMASGCVTSWQTEGEKVVVTNFLFLGSKIAVDGDCSHEIRR